MSIDQKVLPLLTLSFSFSLVQRGNTEFDSSDNMAVLGFFSPWIGNEV